MTNFATFIKLQTPLNLNNGLGHPRGLALKIKAQRLFPSDKFMGVTLGCRQVNALRGVCGINGVKRAVCR